MYAIIGLMTVECKHYILKYLPVARTVAPEGTTAHLETLYNPEAAQLGYSFLGKAKATSISIVSPDTVSINVYNPNRGSMTGQSVEVLERDDINKKRIEGNFGCVGALVGYRRRYHWRP